MLTALAAKQQWKLSQPTQAIRWTSDDPATKPPCTQCNLCGFNCNVGAKVGMDQTLIPSAIKAGAVLRELCDVQTVEPVAGGYEVRFHDTRQGRTAVLRAPRVVMSAGTMNTLRILLRSTVAGGLGAIPSLGRHFSLGGDNLALYRLPRDIGPKKIEGHFLDGVMAVPGAKGFDHQSMCFAPPFLGGSWLMRTLQGQRTLTLFGFGPDAMDGEVSWKGEAWWCDTSRRASLHASGQRKTASPRNSAGRRPLAVPKASVLARGSAAIRLVAVAWRPMPAAAWSTSEEKCSAILVFTLPTPRCFRP